MWFNILTKTNYRAHIIRISHETFFVRNKQNIYKQ